MRVHGVIVSVALTGACGGETVGKAGVPDAPDSSTTGSGGRSAVDSGPVVTDAGPPPTTPQSGSRIKVVAWTSGDTVLGQQGLRDAERGVDCTLEVSADGSRRCLPANAEASVVFRDSKCREPLLRRWSDACVAESPRHMTYKAGAVCPIPEVHVVEQGAPVDPPAIVWGWNGAVCWEQLISPGDQFYEAVPSAPEDWVGFERELTRVTDELGVETWVGSDGSRVAGDLRLLPDDIACEPLNAQGWAAVDPPNRCVPKDRARKAGNLFSDEKCETHVMAGDECRPPRIVELDSEPTTNVCEGPSPQRFFDLGQETAKATISWNIRPTCEPAPTSWLDGLLLYALGDRFGIERYPLLETEQRGGGRLRLRYWTSGGHDVTDVAGYEAMDGGGTFDSLTGAPCSPARFDDGKTRCVSELGIVELGNGGVPEGAYFADPACERPLYRMQGLACGAPSNSSIPIWVEIRKSSSPAPTCSEPVHGQINRVGEEYFGALYQLGPDCRPAPPLGPVGPVEPGKPTPYSRFFLIGDPVDPDDAFVEMTTREL